MKTFNYVVCALLIGLVLVPMSMPSFVQAEDTPPLTLPYDETSSSTFAQVVVDDVPRPVGAIDCFQYYNFGSVQVDIEPSVQSTVPGTPITFSGDITNNNPYPVIDGTVMVKIFKITGQDKDLAHGNGFPVVDQYFALEHITLPANGKKTVSFDWNVPGYALTGEYELHTFFMTSQRYNLLGLPFTDDITGNRASFKVVSQVAGNVVFDKNNVLTNKQLYRFASFPPQFKKSEPVTISANVVNTTKVAQTAVITWTLYNWAGERAANRLDGKTETVVLLPGQTRTVSYVAEKSNGTVSFVQAEVKYKDSKSLLNVRFTREGYSDTRLNFPSTLTYPLVAGQEAGVFSCLHSTGASIVEGGKLNLTVKDLSGAVLHTYTYEGAVTGDMMGVKDSFVPTVSLSDFDVTAELWNNGKIVEEITIPYRCNDIDPSLCVKNTEEVTGGTAVQEKAGGTMSAYRLLWAGAAVVVVLIIVLLWMIRRRMTVVASNEGSIKLPGDFLLLLFVVAASLLAVPSLSFAKSVTYSTSNIPTLYQYYHWDDGLLDNDDHYWNKGVSPGSAQVTYRAQLENASTGEILNFATAVPVGTKVRVKHIPYEDHDIHWVGTGYGFDSPYGYWFKDAGPHHGWKNGPPGRENANPDFVGIYTSGNFCRTNTAYVYVLFDVNPPTPEVINPSSNLSCEGNVCLVTNTGSISVGMKFPQTFGQFFYRAYVTELKWHNGCPANMSLGFKVSVPPMSADGSDDNSYHAPYQVIVPEQTITLGARAFAVSARPNDVTVTPLPNNSELTDEGQGFDLFSTDPDANQIRYGIDWDMSGDVDQWSPGAGYVDSGTTRRVFHTWTIPGTYTFRVWAQDNTGRLSNPVDTDITITQPPPTATLNVPDCVIAIGQKTCTSTVIWSFDHADVPYVVRNNTTNTLIGSDVSGTAPTVLEYGNNVFVARSKGVTLDTADVQTFCVTGAAWDIDDDACIDMHIPALSLWASHDIVRMKATTTLQWNISDLVKNTCTIKGPGLATPYAITTKTGSVDIGQISSVSIFTLTCTSTLHEDVSIAETVEVIPSVIEI